jgi:putative oxygen-independent coproporphyrinogen III oxidase
MAEFGVYVHIPFCRSRCDYCAFATWTDRGHLVDAYVDAVIADIGRAVADGMPVADTVFFGGGTPTLIDPADIARIIAAIPVSGDAEITVECNPDDVTPGLMDTFAAAGVNRVSIGVQSMVTHVLSALGRHHDQSNVAVAVRFARAAGIERINLDLIYGSVGESLEDWRATVSAALELRPTHVSAYGLTVEAGTPLADDPARHPDDDEQADKYIAADDLLTAAGLVNYEISNWSLPGEECRHNMVYWDQGNYRGFGCAAHSHEDGHRWWNVRTPDRYIDLVAAGQPVMAADEHLEPAVREFERLELSLRTRRGVPASALGTHTGDLTGLVEVTDGTAVLTRDGRLLANEISTRLNP